MAPEFEVVVSADEVVHSKPAPDCYLLALQQMGLLGPARPWHLKTPRHGVASAIAAGAGVCGHTHRRCQPPKISVRRLWWCQDMAAAVDWVLKRG